MLIATLLWQVITVVLETKFIHFATKIIKKPAYLNLNLLKRTTRIPLNILQYYHQFLRIIEW